MIGVGFTQQGVKLHHSLENLSGQTWKSDCWESPALLCSAQPLRGTELWLLLRC